MADSDSTIRVHIVGDTRGLNSALDKGGASIAGFAKKAAIGLVALDVVKEGFEFAGDSLGEFDRLGDATARLEFHLGTLTGPLQDTADDFSSIGQSAQDMLELEAIFADVVAPVGIAAPIVGDLADNVAATAAAMHLLGQGDASTIVDAIGKAAGGAEKPLKLLGINLSDAEVEARAMADTGKDTAGALTDSELATARLELILEKLAPKLADATQGSADLEQKQSELDAKVETLAGKFGGLLAPAIEDVTDFLIDEIDAIPHAIAGFEMLGAKIEGFVRMVLGPLGNVRDVIEAISDAVNPGSSGAGHAPAGFSAGGFDENDVWRAVVNHNERNGLTHATGPQIHR